MLDPAFVHPQLELLFYSKTKWQVQYSKQGRHLGLFFSCMHRLLQYIHIFLSIFTCIYAYIVTAREPSRDRDNEGYFRSKRII